MELAANRFPIKKSSAAEVLLQVWVRRNSNWLLMEAATMRRSKRGKLDCLFMGTTDWMFCLLLFVDPQNMIL
jgi:hypothetical protein